MSSNFEYKKRNFFETDRAKDAYDYAELYKVFLDASKTEREAVIYAEDLAKKEGFKPYTLGMKLKAGDKLYYNNRGKSLFLFRVGKEDISNGMRFAIAHVDSPRLDLKQCPLYEDAGLAFFKTHYYGGIRKYQWVTIPLALHGVVVKADGTKVCVNIGEDENDPVFYIDDLLPHLGYEQGKKPLNEAIPAETLNILIGSRKLNDGTVKDNILAILNEKYGITEADLISAELSGVPAGKCRDLGFDRSLLAGYGHDDRCCSYPALTAILGCKDKKHTIMTVLIDKEEIGSEGVSGMQCQIFEDLIDNISIALGGVPAQVRAASKCLSADVSAAYDPNFPEAFEKRNCAEINCGTVFNKYTGARGKSGSNDTSAEYFGWLRQVMDKYDIVWQTGELGKVDFGGGGTIAKYVAKLNIDTVDLGIAVISMHAPCEVISKGDLYETYRAFDAFFKF